MRIATQIKAERRTIFASVYNTLEYYTDKNGCSKSDECIGNIEDVTQWRSLVPVPVYAVRSF